VQGNGSSDGLISAWLTGLIAKNQKDAAVPGTTEDKPA
jgi:hypothetical protein